MTRNIKYALVYRRLEERITLDRFDSVAEAISYCIQEGIDEPLSITRIEKIEETVLDRSQLEKLIGKSE